MAFKRTPSEKFTAKVTVNVPNEKGGHDKNTFTATFRRPSTDEQNELRAVSNEEVVRRTLVGWEMVDEDTGEAVPFSKAEMEAALQIAPTPIATALAFWEAVTGARVKN